jgi:hypothetical protein
VSLSDPELLRFIDMALQGNYPAVKVVYGKVMTAKPGVPIWDWWIDQLRQVSNPTVGIRCAAFVRAASGFDPFPQVSPMQRNELTALYPDWESTDHWHGPK